MFRFDRSLRTVVCAASLLAACSKESKPSTDAGVSEPDAGELPTTRFVGAVDDSDALVAIVRGGTNLRLFFCGGPSSVENATQWFNLDMQDMQDMQNVTIATPWQVSAHIASDAVTGQITRDDGIARNFSAAPIASETLAGLYEGKGDCGRLGLIVSQPDQNAEIVAQGACVGDGHLPEQVNPILPVVLDTGTIAVQVPGGSADETTQLMAAALQPL